MKKFSEFLVEKTSDKISGYEPGSLSDDKKVLKTVAGMIDKDLGLGTNINGKKLSVLTPKNDYKVRIFSFSVDLKSGKVMFDPAPGFMMRMTIVSYVERAIEENQ